VRYEMDLESKIKKSEITTTQLRLLLSNAAVIKNKIEMDNLKNKTDILPQKLQTDIKYLLIKHIYQCGRDKKVKVFETEFEIKDKIKKIKDSKEAFNNFYRYLEEIVAYTKFYRE
jgi:CRISPR-associated protein Csm2